MNKEILKEIDNAIKYVWKYDIKTDYENNTLLREDTLKNSLYFHLRTKLNALFNENNIKIFTEFKSDKFKKINYRPDMVLVKLDKNNNISEYICIIELKFKNDFSAAADLVYKDYDKIRYYIEKMNLNCTKYYMDTIWETKTNSKKWLDNEEWAKGLVTELNADYDSKNNMSFYIKQH